LLSVLLCTGSAYAAITLMDQPSGDREGERRAVYRQRLFKFGFLERDREVAVDE